MDENKIHIEPMPVLQKIDSFIATVKLSGDDFGVAELALSATTRAIDRIEVGESLIEMADTDPYSFEIMVTILAQPSNKAARDSVREYIVECKDGPYSGTDDWEETWEKIMDEL